MLNNMYYIKLLNLVFHRLQKMLGENNSTKTEKVRIIYMIDKMSQSYHVKVHVCTCILVVIVPTYTLPSRGSVITILRNVKNMMNVSNVHKCRLQ